MDLRGHQTQFYIDVTYGIGFAAGFGYLLFVGMDPRIAAFQGGLVLGYILRVWENMQVYEQILQKEVAAEAQEAVAAEAEVAVAEEAEEAVAEEAHEAVSREIEERVGEEMDERFDAEIDERVAEEVEEQMDDRRSLPERKRRR